jgi:3-oxoacyl-[acyl-carrier protein] reductase
VPAHGGDPAPERSPAGVFLAARHARDLHDAAVSTPRLTDRVAIVTGGARGIGGAIAAAMADEGADVVIADVLPESAAKAVLDAIARAGRRAVYVPTDVTDAAQIEAMVARAIGEFGHVDILVNNAGVAGQCLFHELSAAEYDRVMAINLRGPFLCSRAVINHMLERGQGRIINVASQLGQIGGDEMVHYSASKAGVIGMTKALAREYSTRGILVNAIAPGPINTSMLDEETEEWIAAKLADLPIGRFGDVHEVAPTAVFLASDDASYYVGQTLCPNGGDVML